MKIGASAPRILIITGEGDTHAQAVAWGLGLLGIKPTIWKWSDFPRHDVGSWQLEADFDPKFSLNIQGTTQTNPFDVVWSRRHVAPIPRSNSHPEDRTVVVEESISFIRSILPFIGSDQTMWVNPIEAAKMADNKVLQLQVARRLGFQVPATMIGNDAAKAREFFHRHHGKIIFKPFRPAKWTETDGTIRTQGTRRVLEHHIDNEHAIRGCPGIFQAEVLKEYELRVTVIGDAVFAGAIYSQRNGPTVDWRQECGDLTSLPFSEITLPEDLKNVSVWSSHPWSKRTEAQAGTAGFQRCGNNSSIRALGWVWIRANTSRR